MEGEASKKPPASAKKKSSSRVKYTKAPQAPKRFKSAYMFFSTEKHKEIREQMGAKAATEKTTNVAKLVSKAWKEMPEGERGKWEDMARKDKARYEREKSMYSGPWKVLSTAKPRKDPNAPKRPMSAFLAYSNAKRKEAKLEFPEQSNTEISRILAQRWKDAPEEERKPFMEAEFKLREEYKVAIAAWRAEQEKELQIRQQHQRELDVARSNMQKLTHHRGYEQQAPPEVGESSMERSHYPPYAATGGPSGVMGNVPYAASGSGYDYAGQYWPPQHDPYASGQMYYPQYQYPPPAAGWPQQGGASQQDDHAAYQAQSYASYDAGDESAASYDRSASYAHYPPQYEGGYTHPPDSQYRPEK